MIDPLVVKAKEGRLSQDELQSALSELDEIARRRAVDPSFLAPHGSQLDQMRQRLDRLRVVMTKQDMEAARLELRGKAMPSRRRPLLVRPANVRKGGVTPSRDPYVLLEIVGEAGGRELSEFIEPFLDSPSDPMVARLALQILTNYWSLLSEYRDKIIEFMRGVPWDAENDVREVAIDAAGEAIRQHRDIDLLHELLEIAEDSKESAAIRGQAIVSLGRAQGMPRQELPNPADKTPLDGRLARAILDNARAMVRDIRGN